MISLLGFLLLFQIPCSVDENRDTIRRLKELGAIFETKATPAGNKYASISFWNSEVTGEMIELAGSVPEVVELNFERSNISNADFAALAASNLKSLTLSDCKVKPSTFVGVKRIESLEEIVFDSVNFDDKCLDHFDGHASLKTVYLIKVANSTKAMKTIGSWTRLEELLIEDSKVSDSEMKYLSPLRNIKTIHFLNTKLTGVGLKFISNKENVKTLRLMWSRINDDGMKEIASFKNVETLELGQTDVTDAGVAHLKSLRKIRDLILVSKRVTDKNLGILKNFVDLESLYLGYLTSSYEVCNCDVTDKCVLYIRDLKKLTVLSLTGTRITDKCGDDLQRMTSLNELYLVETRITDKFIRHLSKLRNLRNLDLLNTDITPSGISALKMALPKTDIIPGDE